MSSLQYRELSLHQHTLSRPDTYVGSIRPQTCIETIITSDLHVSKKEITYIPAMLRLFIEALSNAIDNKQRSDEHNVPMKSIKVSVNPETFEISVWNDGLTIPVRLKDETEDNVYIPEMLFGRLLTSSNYNDDEERLTSGKNGLGITCTNIFSKYFRVDIQDTITAQSYTQTWSDNMTKKTNGMIKKYKLKSGSTCVSWIPDFDYFQCSPQEQSDLIALFKRYTYEAAMLTGLKVFFNDVLCPLRSLKEYAMCYCQDTLNVKCLVIPFQRQQCVLLSDTSFNEFESVSFVNGIHTPDGGVHVDVWIDTLLKPVLQKLNQRGKWKLTLRDLKPYFKLFVVSYLPNPEFTSQSKTKCCGPKPSLTGLDETKYVSTLLKWDFVTSLKQSFEAKETLSLKKTERKRGFCKIDGYDTANKAGTKEGMKCTLILCEGLSAKTYAVTGINTGAQLHPELPHLKGRDWYGVYAMRGKCLNVRNVSTSDILKNKEMTAIIQALGVQHGVDYSRDEHYRTLRYGHLMGITDSDNDGLHILGLIINMLDVLFPSLLHRPGFFVSMQTPVLSVQTKKKMLRFYDTQSAREYLLTHTPSPSSIKYYKGLGTSTDRDIKETFGQRIILFPYDTSAEVSLNKVFHKQYAAQRKDWMSVYKTDTPTPYTSLSSTHFSLPISQFIDHEFIKFSIEDCKRSLPHLLDGLKESQRKVLHACILKKLTGKTLKVAQLSGFVAEQTNYHHGEQNLYDTITKMAQDFIGSNNIPLLFKDGQMGTRAHLGKDAANARYIFTRLSDITRLIFRPEDDTLLEYIQEEGDSIEPEHYIPIIPMILVNGCTAGIGTGWSCSIPNYNPVDIIQWIKYWLGKNDEPVLIPWYRYFQGTITPLSNGKFETKGVFTGNGKGGGVLTEIPIGLSIEKCKDYLEGLLEQSKIKKMKNYSTPDQVHFEVNGVQSLEDMNLTSIVSTTNMVLFHKGTISKYSTLNDILKTFCETRLEWYQRRIHLMIQQLEADIRLLTIKHKFILKVINNPNFIHGRQEQDIVSDLKTMFPKFEEYDTLLSLPVKQFTTTKLEQLQGKIASLEEKRQYYIHIPPATLWLKELEELEKFF